MIVYPNDATRHMSIYADNEGRVFRGAIIERIDPGGADKRDWKPMWHTGFMTINDELGGREVTVIVSRGEAGHLGFEVGCLVGVLNDAYTVFSKEAVKILDIKLATTGLVWPEKVTTKGVNMGIKAKKEVKCASCGAVGKEIGGNAGIGWLRYASKKLNEEYEMCICDKCSIGHALLGLGVALEQYTEHDDLKVIGSCLVQAAVAYASEVQKQDCKDDSLQGEPSDPGDVFDCCDGLNDDTECSVDGINT